MKLLTNVDIVNFCKNVFFLAKLLVSKCVLKVEAVLDHIHASTYAVFVGFHELPKSSYFGAWSRDFLLQIEDICSKSFGQCKRYRIN